DPPCIVLGKEGDLAKGSGRSVEGVNLVQALSGFSDRLESWGGHPMAVGVNIQIEFIEELCSYFHEAIEAANAAPAYEKTLEIATYLELENITPQFMDEFDFLQPFGQENPEPIFATRSIRFRQRPKIFKDAHFRFSLSDKYGRPLQGVAWNLANRVPKTDTLVDIAYRLAWNSFGRQKALQLELVDWKYSKLA
ncbi:MAG TPA: single-stranded-DNA-specific exonuclease RecJ, partial [Opitutae bacterium]|nr:single-stranded-DNA-specific exonuclease RecJ [Opitutae bacterium]